MSRLEITTNPGLEELVIGDLTRSAAAVGVRSVVGTCRPHQQAGWVAIEADAPPDLLRDLALRLRSAHHVVRPIHEFDLAATDPLGQIQAELASLAIPELEPEGTSFRVTSSRTGDHPFTSEDVQRVAGAGVRDRAWRAVSLKDHDVNLRVDVHGTRCSVGVQYTREALSQRHERPFLLGAALRCNVAWAMLHLAGPEPTAAPRRLLDPFCGCGTILLEAGSMWPGVELAGSDTSARCVEGARQNLAANALQGVVRPGDARDVAGVWAGRRFDAVVSNPPFGRRLGANIGYEALYGGLLDGLLEVTEPGARLVFLVLKRGAFQRALRTRSAYALRHARIVEVGGLHPGMLLLERQG